jgi:hypothetical protein
MLLAGCDFWGQKQASNKCQCLECLEDSAGLKYSVKGPLQAFTLSDSFSQLKAGNEWVYELTSVSGSSSMSDGPIPCETITMQVTKNTGNMAIIKGTGNTDNVPSFDTIYITNDSITQSLGNDLDPILLGSRKSIYPCFKLDDSGGYIYGMFYGETSYYISYIGLVYLIEPFGGGSYEWYKIESFNGKQISNSDLFECVAKLDYYNKYPDSIIISTLTESSPPAKSFAGIFPGYKSLSNFDWWTQSRQKLFTFPAFPKKS